MRKILFSSLVMVLIAAQMVLAHDPRTTAKNLSHSLSIEGAGKLTISYKSLHFNEPNFNNRKTERLLNAFNRVWKSIGKLESDFDVVIGGVQVPKGSYTLGFNYDANDNYKLILSAGGKDITIPLQMAMDGVQVNYLSLDLRPENETDTFVFEARYGKLRTTAETKVPYLAPHAHDEKTESKPPEKKP